MSSELLERAVGRWDELVLAEGRSVEQLASRRARLDELGILAGERALCTVLRPHLVTEEQLAEQGRVAALISSAAIKVRDAVLADERLHRRHLGPFMEWIGELVELDTNPLADGALIRLDASLARTQLHFIELNADCPGGAGHHDSILEFFAGLDTYGRFAAEYDVRPLPLAPRLLETLLGAWRDWGGAGEPSLTVLTRTDDPLRVGGLEVEVGYYRSQGVEARICDFRALSYADGALRADGAKIDVLHRQMPTAECLELRTELEPLFAAVKAGTVCMVNPFRSELLGHKALFALMGDPEHDFGLSAAERAAIREHVPWARALVDRPGTDPQGEALDLVPYVLAAREHLVLKPAHLYGGREVLLGWQHSESDWRGSVERALGGDYIVQRRVPLHRTSYPTLEDPSRHQSFFEDTDPFAFEGRLGGFLTRLSREEITNVHAGGSLTASFALGSGSKRAVA